MVGWWWWFGGQNVQQSSLKIVSIAGLQDGSCFCGSCQSAKGKSFGSILILIIIGIRIVTGNVTFRNGDARWSAARSSGSHRSSLQVLANVLFRCGEGKVAKKESIVAAVTDIAAGVDIAVFDAVVSSFLFHGNFFVLVVAMWFFVTR